MCSLESLKIDLKALKEGNNMLSFVLSDDYFQFIAAPEVSRGDVKIALQIHRSADIFTLDFHVEGIVVIPCDLCLDDMAQAVTADSRFTACFGNEGSDDDELLTVNEDDGILDVSWLIYEQIVLAIPIKHVHAPGKCNVAMTKKLNELSAARSSNGMEDAIDPRWKALEKFKM
ncbi:MAG: DUF177 domain-containing protein [Prevotella sp.]|nr:DUF177 domain-containing protein [Prevotella sp.]